MGVCKHYNSMQVVKKGFVRKKERYFRNNCSRTFVNRRCKEKRISESKENSGSYLYSLGKAAFVFFAKLLGVSRSLAH